MRLLNNAPLTYLLGIEVKFLRKNTRACRVSAVGNQYKTAVLGSILNQSLVSATDYVEGQGSRRFQYQTLTIFIIDG